MIYDNILPELNSLKYKNLMLNLKFKIKFLKLLKNRFISWKNPINKESQCYILLA